MPSPRTAIPREIPFGMIVYPGQSVSALPLEKTTITGQVTGSLASISVAQSFTNPLTEPVELEYLFPLPHKAAILDFELQIAGRVIRGDIRETEKARQDYEEALSHGQQAALLEERRPNLFAVRLANVRPAEKIRSLIRYQETLAFQDGEYELVIPMGLTPRYTSPTHPDEGNGVNAPIARQDEKIGPVEVSIAVDAGVTLADPTSPSHSLSITRLDERRVNLTLAKSAIPDHDFVLRLPVSGDALRLSTFRSSHAGGDVFVASLLPPALMDPDAAPAPREFVFVLDRSGSMSGEPIAQARNALRACLRILNPTDTFSILLFDHELEWHQPEAAPVTQSTIDAADQFLAGIEGRGGTEIIQAIQVALALAPDARRTRYLVFLTDGAVAADERAISEIRRNLGSARVFTFGIGPSVNRALLQKLAAVGRGTCEFLQLDEDIEGAILRFQDRVSFPVVTDLRLTCLHGKLWDAYPSLLPDVYAGAPLQIVGRVKPSGEAAPQLVIDGLRQGQPVRMMVDLTALPAPEPAVLRAWARARIDDLEEQAESGAKPFHQVRDEIIGLALEHRLVTRFTSFVAIDTTESTSNGKPRLVRISQPLPQGLDLDGFAPAAAPLYKMMPPAPSAPPSPARYLKQSFLREESAPIAKADSSNLNIPAFLMRRGEPEQSVDSLAPTGSQPEMIQRWLARTQNLDGSWPQGAEFSALALLFFVRSGCTTRTGHYRRQVKRAAEYLLTSPGSGFAAFLAALALKELAASTGAAELAAQLPAPATTLEQAAYSNWMSQPISIQTPSAISNLDDLRLARLAGSDLDAPAQLLSGAEADLARLWSVLPV